MLNAKKVLLVSFFIVGCLLISGCSDKEQSSKKEEIIGTTEKPQIQKEVVQNDTNKVQAENKNVVPDFKGSWRGKFDSRDATLSIVEQNGNSFKGNITVNYRNVSKQEVEGTIDTVTNNVFMKDMLHSRAKGVYSAKLSDDLKSMEGIFTMNLDGKKLKFNLNKKQL